MPYSKEFLDQMAQSQEAFIWEAPAWELQDRGPRWYLWMGAAVLLLTGYAIYTANYLFAFIILLTAIILVIAGEQKTRKILVQIGDNGVVYDGRLFRFDELHNFAIIYQPPQTKVLYIEPNSVRHPRLRISLEDEDPVALRNHLRQYLTEDLDLQDEHYSDIVARLLKL
ncbi:MAG: hypothetical protein RDU25_02245 [Patescibacteria group bacterium]|nr:hypothetical protein [Patescibacteria group bacterium]